MTENHLLVCGECPQSIYFASTNHHAAMNSILFQEEVKLAQHAYHTHRLLAQFAFHDDPVATELLQLCESTASANWLAEAAEFYQIVVPMAEFMQQCGVHKDELRQARAMVETVAAKTILTAFSDN